MRPIHITPPDPRPGSSSKSGPPPGAGGDFAAMLDQTSARTAPAEGQQTQPACTAPRRPDARDRPERRDHGAEASDPSATAAQQASAAPAPAPSAQTDAPGAPAGDAEPAPAPADPPPAPSLTTPDPSLTAQPVPSPAVPDRAAASATSSPAAPAPTAPVLPGGSPATPAPVTTSPGPAVATEPAAPGPAVAPTSAAPAPGLSPDAAPKPGDDGAQPDDERRPGTEAPQPAPSVTPATDPAAAPAPAISPAQTAQAPAPAAPVPGVNATQAAPAPAASPAPGAPTVAHLTAGSLHATIDKVHDLVRISAMRGGGARATLQLKPVELGLVDVQLRTTRDGLVATISAQDSAGLSALQQAGAELRRSLEDRGVTLARLDLQLAAGQDGQATGDQGRHFGGTRGSAGASGLPADELDGDDEELLVASVTRSSPHGLVDIQA